MSEKKISRRNYVKYVGGAVAVAAIAATGYGAYMYSKPKPTPTPTPTRTTPTPTTTTPKPTTPKPTSGPPLKLGGTACLTGFMAAVGIRHKEALDMWLEEVNAEGGILNRKVELTLYDDESNTELAQSLYEKLVTVDKVDVLIGPGGGSATGYPVSTIGDRHRIPLLLPIIATSHTYQRGLEYVFGLSPTVDVYNANFIPSTQTLSDPPKTVAWLNQAFIFPRAIVNAAKIIADRLGIETVFHEEYPTETTDFTSTLLKIKAKEPDILYVGGQLPHAVPIVKQMKELDLNTKLFHHISGATYKDFVEALGSDADYVCSVSQWETSLPESIAPGITEFTRKWEQKYEYRPDYVSATPYVCMQVIQQAIEAAGSTDNEAIRDAYLTEEFSTIMGPIRFGETEYNGIPTKYVNVTSPVYTFQWQNGKLEVVFPYSARTTDIVYPMPTWKERG
jgi:branched-chain amino acid transport system substrate-binding protein